MTQLRRITMLNKEFLASESWEEFASQLPHDLSDTERLMAAVFFRADHESIESTDMTVIATDYFRRARWSRPSNLAATANHCASKGWLSEVGQNNNRKLWR